MTELFLQVQHANILQTILTPYLDAYEHEISIYSFIITDVLGKVQHRRRFYCYQYLNSLPRKRSFASSRNPREGMRDEALRT